MACLHFFFFTSFDPFLEQFLTFKDRWRSLGRSLALSSAKYPHLTPHLAHRYQLMTLFSSRKGEHRLRCCWETIVIHSFFCLLFSDHRQRHTRFNTIHWVMESLLCNWPSNSGSEKACEVNGAHKEKAGQVGTGHGRSAGRETAEGQLPHVSLLSSEKPLID